MIKGASTGKGEELGLLIQSGYHNNNKMIINKEMFINKEMIISKETV